jgi:transposase-like protein
MFGIAVAGRWFEDEIISLYLCEYFGCKISYRDVVEMNGERGLPIARRKKVSSALATFILC